MITESVENGVPVYNVSSDTFCIELLLWLQTKLPEKLIMNYMNVSYLFENKSQRTYWVLGFLAARYKYNNSSVDEYRDKDSDIVS